jgi:hypothetical protein
VPRSDYFPEEESSNQFVTGNHINYRLGSLGIPFIARNLLFRSGCLLTICIACIAAASVLGLVLKTDHEVAVGDRDRFRSHQLEPAILTIRGLVVADIRFGRHYFEVDAPAVGQPERVVLKVFGTLDVVLISVSPMQLDLFALVRDCIDPWLRTPALG